MSASDLSVDQPGASGSVPAVTAELPIPARRYAHFGGGTPNLDRHPDDGWQIAHPFPMGRPARKALRGLARILCPPSPAPQLPDLEDRIEHETRTLMRYMPLPVAWLVRLSLRIIDQAPRLLLVSRRRLHRLDVEAARAVVHRLASSPFGPIRELVGVARSLVLSIYFDQDEVHRELGYAPVPFMRSRIALRHRLLDGAAHRDGDIIPVAVGLEP